MRSFRNDCLPACQIEHSGLSVTPDFQKVPVDVASFAKLFQVLLFAAFVMTLTWLLLILCIQGYFGVVGQFNHLLSQWLEASADTA